jgi:hypothetical protein
MILYNPNHQPTLPGALICQPACLLSFPTSVEVEDPWLNGGSGIGSGSSSLKAALGEYFERRHFYMEIKSELVGNINHSLAKEEVAKFLHAFSQTNDRNLTSDQISEHAFNLTKVYRTSDFSSCYIPTACISLNSHRIESENIIYPLRDTCGCSFHWSANRAIFGSTQEYLERQFLARFWLTKKCLNLISHHNAKTLLNNSRAQPLYNALNKSGEIAVIDISDPNYPGTCLLTVYGQKNRRRHIQYCAGMSYAETPSAALEKSTHELWQTYRFIHLFKTTDRNIQDIKDPYLRHFLNCNSYETFKEITSVEPSGIARQNQLIDFSLSGFLSALKTQQIDSYIYINTTAINGNLYFFCKFLSPDLFLHMNNSKNINIHNTYSKSFLNQILPDRKRTMVPFP